MGHKWDTGMERMGHNLGVNGARDIVRVYVNGPVIVLLQPKVQCRTQANGTSCPKWDVQQKISDIVS